MTIYCKHGSTYYRVSFSPAMAKKWDNGALISCGLTIPDDAPYSALCSWKMQHKAMECSESEWRHSGCQSRCTLRGDDKCQW